MSAPASLFLEIPRFDTEFLYTTGLAAGLGSNDIGLDRGQEGAGRIVLFQRVGPKVLLMQPNESFRSSSTNPAEEPLGGRFVRQIGPVGIHRRRRNQRPRAGGRHRFRPARRPRRGQLSASGNLSRRSHAQRLYMERTKAFPKNTEIEVTLTFANEAAGGGRGGGGSRAGTAGDLTETPGAAAAGGGGRGGGLFSGTVASVTPTSEAVTLREHYSLVELPDDNFKPREDDPRAGYGGMNYVDYSMPIGEPMVKRYIRRHRLEKKDPNAAISEPVKPIEYWVDSGAPDDVKKALVEGASWWNQAFEAAGFRNAIQSGRAARGRRPHGHSLQHDQLGAPFHARLELPAERSPIRAPAKLSRGRSPSAPCATARIT